MTEKASKSGGRGGREAADLMRALAERERQLRDLTEQALGFLEELAESRRQNRDRELLSQRLGELERNLVDARARLRHAGVAAATGGSAAVPLEIVCWGEGARARATAVRSATADVPVIWIALPAEAPADDEPHALVHRDARTEAQCWNLGMAATHGAAVLFLGPGTSLEQDAPLPLAAALPHTAILCPRVQRPDGAETGREETDDLLHLRPRQPAGGHAQTPAAVPFPSADAFFVRRAAFEHVGLFDEAVTGPATLLDWVFRARARNLEVVAAPDFAVTGAPPASDDERQRLRMLARHRPAALGRALAASDLLWQLEPAAAREFLQGLLAELPAGDDLTAQRAALDAIALGLVAQATPPGQLAARLQAIRIALLQPLAEAAFAPGHAEVQAALQDAQAATPPAAVALTALQRDLDLDRRVRSAMLEALATEQAERRRLDGEFHAQLARAERADGAVRATAERLDRREGECRRLEQELATLRDAHAAAEHLLHACQRRLVETEHALEASNRRQAESEDALEASSRREAELDRALHALSGQIERIVPGLRELHRQLSALQGAEQGEPPADVDGLLTILHSEARGIAAATQGVQHNLGERERWIGLLLQEVARRRLFPRRLLDHELALLRRTGQLP